MPQFDTPIKQALRRSATINNGRIRIKKARKMYTGISLERQYQRRIRKLIIGNMKEVINIVLIPKINSILERLGNTKLFIGSTNPILATAPTASGMAMTCPVIKPIAQTIGHRSN